MKSLVLTLQLFLLTFLGIPISGADTIIDSHTVDRNNPNPTDKDGFKLEKDGEIDCTVEKTITDLGTQVKSFVSSTVFMTFNGEEAGFTGFAQVRGSADTGLSSFYEASYNGISGGKPDWISLETLEAEGGTEFSRRLPAETGNGNLLYSGAKKQGVSYYRSILCVLPGIMVNVKRRVRRILRV